MERNPYFPEFSSWKTCIWAFLENTSNVKQYRLSSFFFLFVNGLWQCSQWWRNQLCHKIFGRWTHEPRWQYHVPLCLGPFHITDREWVVVIIYHKYKLHWLNQRLQAVTSFTESTPTPVIIDWSSWLINFIYNVILPTWSQVINY